MELISMKVIKVTPRGYCKGVVRAISIAKQCAKEYPEQPITVLGMLVHNEYVKKALEAKGIHTVEDATKTRMQLLDDIHEGIVIFTAHGISDEVKEKAMEKGLHCIDASCPDVVKTQNLVRDHLQKGYEIFYIGKQHHPEAEAVCALSDHIHLITSIDDIPKDIHSPLFVTNQTTMSIFDVERIFQQIQKDYPDACLSEEICNATRIRQQAVADLKNKNVDVLYVVGDSHSNNSKRLAQIGKEQGIPHVYRIDDVYGIQAEQLMDCSTVAVTSGASTPTYLTNQVIEVLEHWEETITFPTICIEKMID